MNSLQTTHSHFPSSNRLLQKLSLFPFLFLFSFTRFLPHFQNPTIFFFHFPLLSFFPFHSAYLFSYPALSFARFSPASSNLTRSNCVASTHSFTTCAFLTCLPLHQSLQMISSVLLSVQLFNLLQLSHASQLSPAISYPSPPAPKTPQNSFSHNNIFTFAIFTYFLHLSTAEPGSFKNPSSCFLNFVICLSFAFSLTSLIFSGLTSSSLQKP